MQGLKSIKHKKVISIDAFNTLFVPRYPVLSQYNKVSQSHGSKTTLDELNIRFPEVYKHMKTAYPNYGKGLQYRPFGTGDLMEMKSVNWWEELIRELYRPEKIPESAVRDIIEVFESDKGYVAYSDVLSFLIKVKKHRELNDNLLVIVSSNGEPRMKKVLESLGLSVFVDHVYLSYEMGVCKPDPRYYDCIADDLRKRYPDSDFEFWHIGDEEVNDVKGSIAAGWNGVLLDRTKHLSSHLKEIEHLKEEERLTRVKMATSYENTKSEDQVFIKRLGEREYMTNAFEGVVKLLNI